MLVVEVVLVLLLVLVVLAAVEMLEQEELQQLQEQQILAAEEEAIGQLRVLVALVVQALLF
jgi:hypothetical protein